MTSHEASDPIFPASHTSDEASFAYSTVRERWPKILTNICETLEHAFRDVSNLAPEDVTAGRKIVEQVEFLKRDLAEDAHLEPLPEDGGTDIAQWNTSLQHIGPISWQNAPWLFSECYMYRLIYTFFQRSTSFWQQYDCFQDAKLDSITKSKAATLELAARVLPILRSPETETLDIKAQKVLFEEMIDISLWGNATDLSLLTTVSLSELQSRQGKAAREASKEKILVDNTDSVWRWLTSSEGKTGVVHIVLDNAGFELLTDLVLAGYLLSAGFAERIVLHGKRMPWFVSDVTPHDLDDLIDGLATGEYWQDELDQEHRQTLQDLGSFFISLRARNKLSAEYHSFWTTQHPFGRISMVAPELYHELAAADLTIFKGDLNYRKLTYDCFPVPRTTPFREAIGPLSNANTGMKVLALRTSKADVCVGLPDGVEQRVEANWAWTGKYGIVSYCEPEM